MPNRTLFRKWDRWLKRIKEELTELVIQQAHFRELQQVVAPYKGRVTGAEIARWMVQGYAAYACMGIRRLTESSSKKPPPKTGDPRLTISLVVLLEDLAANNFELTRSRQRKMYQRAMRHLRDGIGTRTADRVFEQVARSKTANVVSASRIKRDIKALKRAANPIKKRVDKVYAHTERDRRRIGRPVYFREIDVAIKILLETYRRYARLLQGRVEQELVPEDEFDIVTDLKKIWP